MSLSPKKYKTRWKKIEDVGISLDNTSNIKLVEEANMNLQEAKSRAAELDVCFFTLKKGNGAYGSYKNSEPLVSFYSGDPIYTKSFTSDAYEKQNHNALNKIRISSFQGEVLGGQDYLNITPDVEAFANLISSRELKPPLSVGLFGDWGSGKSFFMNKIHEEVEDNMAWAKLKVKEHVDQFLNALMEIDTEEDIAKKILGLFPHPEEKYEQIKTWIRKQPARAYDSIAKEFHKNPAEREVLISDLRENPNRAKEKILEKLAEKYENTSRQLAKGFIEDQEEAISYIRKLEEIYAEKEIGYCRSISQIRFNAWHYVDSNLWASMISNIFEDLGTYIGLLPDSEAKVIQLWEDLSSTQELILENEAEKETLQKTRTLLDEELVKLVEEKTQTEKTLSGISFKSIWKEVLSGESAQATLPEALAKFEEAKEKLGIREDINLETDREKLEELFENINSTRGRTLKIFEEIEPKKWSPSTWLILGLFSISILFLLISSNIEGFTNSWLAPAAKGMAFLTSIYGLIGKGLNKGGQALKKVNEGLDLLASAKNSVNRLQEEASRELDHRITATKEELLILTQKIADKDEEIGKLLHQTEKIDNELDAIRKGKRLSSFIQRRLGSNDYKKHLGLISIVRDDFEKLADYLHNKNTLDDFIEERDARLTQKVVSKSEGKDAPEESSGIEENQDSENAAVPREKDLVKNFLDEFLTKDDSLKKPDIPLETEELRSTPGGDIQMVNPFLLSPVNKIDRIVLYIDDLDRCPPDKVVEVLEAIHLILAFPLFVVVVGVDVRWISKSLVKKYGAMLNKQRIRKEEDDEFSLLQQNHATPYDYLEKIFQIPFRIKSMDTHDKKIYLEKLLESDLTEPLEALETHSYHYTDTKKAETQEAAENQEQESLNKKLEKINLQKQDLFFIKSLAPIINNSPRAIKRFANICRLIKSHQKWTRPETNESKSTKLTEYESMVFLLALISGLPALADKLIISLQKWTDSLGRSENSEPKILTLSNFAYHLKEQQAKDIKWEKLFSKEEDPRLKKEWTVLYNYLTSRVRKNDETSQWFTLFQRLSAYDILDQAKTAFRFSFRFDEY